MAFATAASLGCRFATSFRAVVDQARTSAGEWVAVHGCGGVGLSTVMIAAALGANVIAVDIDDAATIAHTNMISAPPVSDLFKPFETQKGAAVGNGNVACEEPSEVRAESKRAQSLQPVEIKVSTLVNAVQAAAENLRGKPK